MKEEKKVRKMTCPYKLICAEYKNNKNCSCSLVGTKFNQVVYDSMKHNVE